MLLLWFMKGVQRSKLFTKCFHGNCPSNKRAINLLLQNATHTHYPINLSDTPETEQRDRPPRFLLPQQMFCHISIFLQYYSSSPLTAITPHPYIHLSIAHDHCSSDLESVGWRSALLTYLQPDTKWGQAVPPARSAGCPPGLAGSNLCLQF